MPDTPIWISHRGYHKQHPENTEAAFRAAVAQGFVELETDLRLSRDGHLVLCHDPDLARLMGAEGEEARAALEIQQMSRAELEAVALPAAESQWGGEGARLMFFAQLIEGFSDLTWTLDIKPEQGAEVLHALFGWAREHGAMAKLAASRFLLWEAEHEAILRGYLPDAVVYARREECWRAGLSVLLRLPWLGQIQPGRIYSLMPRAAGMAVYRPRVVQAYHRRGAQVLAFLPEVERDIRDAIDAGFDYILTNGQILSQQR